MRKILGVLAACAVLGAATFFVAGPYPVGAQAGGTVEVEVK